jgi:hypothetical protein
VLAAFFDLLLFASAPAYAEKRVALLVGNAAYKNVGTAPHQEPQLTLQRSE